jgi:hypothetical protein
MRSASATPDEQVDHIAGIILSVNETAEQVHYGLLAGAGVTADDLVRLAANYRLKAQALTSLRDTAVSNRRGKARRTAPETSKRAASKVEPRSGTQRFRVLEAIRRAKGNGLTDDEIEQLTGLAHQTASARRNELAEGGFIVETTKRRKTRNDKLAIVWVATEHALPSHYPTHA